MARPLIAVTGPDRRFSTAWIATRLSLKLTGAEAVRLTASNYREHERENINGIIIGGGDDIDPTLYGGTDDGVAPIDRERDRFEIAMIEEALETHLPILGICRGAQLINVVLGGSLYPDIRPLRRKTSNRRTPFPRKTALSADDGRLSDALQRERWRVNSLHHQAIDRVGEGMKVVARDLDGFVQAVESTDQRFILGVQWHPEYLPYISYQRRVFACLVEQSRRTIPEPLHE